MRPYLRLLVVYIFLLGIVCHSNLIAQSQTNGDRLARVRDIINNSELVIIWSEGENNNEHYGNQIIYNLDMTQPNIDQTLVAGSVHTDSIVTGNRQMAVASGNFLGLEYKHFVAAWPGPDNSITVIVPEIDPGSLSWAETSRLSIQGPLSSGGARKIHLATGDLFGADRTDEFVLAYQGPDSSIHLQVFSFEPGNLTPIPRGNIHNEKIFIHDGVRHDNWDIIAGDFNGDGYDEIALLFVKPLIGSNWALSITIYSADEQGNLAVEASQEIFYRPAYNITSIHISGSSGDFDEDPFMEIAFGFSFAQQESGNDTYVYILDIQDNLKTIVASDVNRIALNAQNESEITPLNIAAGDLNGDYRDELVLVTAGSTRIYSVDEQSVPQLRLTRGAPTPSLGNEDYFLAVGDMDGSGSSEIVMATNYRETEPGGRQYFEIIVMSVDDNISSSTIKGRKEFERQIPSDMGYRNFAIALGDFNGDRIWLGSPVHYRRTGVLQPSVILYAPPVHYDILNGTTFDLSGCFPNQGCGFLSTFVQTTSSSNTVSIEHHEDWGMSAGIELKVPGSKLKMEVTYGEKFKNSTKQTETMTISSGRTAAGDDWIFASIYDIDFYEYPVYEGTDPTPIGFFLVSLPSNIRPLWIEGKNDNVLGNIFRPDHEVGNILSYRPYNVEANPDLASHIVNFQEQTIGATGNSFVSLELGTFMENSAETSWEAGGSFEQGLGGEGKIKGFEVEFYFNWGGEYNRGEITTQTVSVNESLQMLGEFGSVESQFGTSGTYHIQPYAYWTEFGALALDYKIDIPGGNNFWNEQYGGGPDLAFSLPWRYDMQKGLPYPGNDASYRYRTRDIVLSDTEPRGGETVTVGARIRNLSLMEVAQPVLVKFYFGDPVSGGAEIAEALIDTIIEPRGAHDVFVEWDIPVDADLKNARIYAVIDPDNNISDEIHDNNNMGWTPVISLGTVTDVGNRSELPVQFALYQAYPNPFNPITTISFDLHTTAHVSLRIYNMLGQEVATLANEVRRAGNHRVHFHADDLASGVYVYRIIVEPTDGSIRSLMDTRKMVYVK